MGKKKKAGSKSGIDWDELVRASPEPGGGGGGGWHVGVSAAEATMEDAPPLGPDDYGYSGPTAPTPFGGGDGMDTGEAAAAGGVGGGGGKKKREPRPKDCVCARCFCMRVCARLSLSLAHNSRRHKKQTLPFDCCIPTPPHSGNKGGRGRAGGGGGGGGGDAMDTGEAGGGRLLLGVAKKAGGGMKVSGKRGNRTSKQLRRKQAKAERALAVTERLAARAGSKFGRKATKAALNQLY